MVRAVTCRSSGGVVTSEEQCDLSLRPLAIYPCGDRDCAPHWVEQEWQQVNIFKDVVLGSFLRWENCLFEAGKVKLFFFVCASQCNATCGRGVRHRQVVCVGLEGGVFKEFPGSSCTHTNQPESSSSCFQRPCSKWFTTSWSQVSRPPPRHAVPAEAPW